jgi:hypothetical protein
VNFIDSCINGSVLIDEIDDFVDRWHDDDSLHVELHEYLGMSWEEYSIWATRPSILPFIFSARKKHTSLDVELQQSVIALAARAETSAEALKVESWLKSMGKM